MIRKYKCNRKLSIPNFCESSLSQLPEHFLSSFWYLFYWTFLLAPSLFLFSKVFISDMSSSKSILSKKQLPNARCTFLFCCIYSSLFWFSSYLWTIKKYDNKNATIMFFKNQISFHQKIPRIRAYCIFIVFCMLRK